MAELLADAKKNRYCLAAPNAFDENHVRYIIEVAKKTNAPIIMDISDSWIRDEWFARNAVMMAREADTPIAVNLDHGKSYEGCMRALRWGFTSVMIDKSKLPFEENIAETAAVVKAAHALGVSVEAELGHVGMGDSYETDGKENLTIPSEAREFVERTGVDCLAIAIGTAHGVYSGTPHIDFERFAEIKKEIDIPFVLHGGSGTGDDNLVKAVEMGVCKVNLYSDLENAGFKRVRECQDFRRLWSETEFGIGYKEKLEHYIRLFGQNDRLQQRS